MTTQYKKCLIIIFSTFLFFGCSQTSEPLSSSLIEKEICSTYKSISGHQDASSIIISKLVRMVNTDKLSIVENNVEKSSCKTEIVYAFENNVIACNLMFQRVYGDICLYQTALSSRPNQSPSFSVKRLEKHTFESMKFLYEKISNEKFEVMFNRVLNR